MAATPRVGTIIAERKLVTRDGAAMRVAIGAPRRRSEADWACPFRIHGGGASSVRYGYGVDSMQALADALVAIRFALDETGLDPGWHMGRGVILEGETGFSRTIPFSFGSAFTRRLERLVDRLLARESTREVQRLQRLAARRRRKAAKAR